MKLWSGRGSPTPDEGEYIRDVTVQLNNDVEKWLKEQAS
jgi:hypothetical protein